MTLSPVRSNSRRTSMSKKELTFRVLVDWDLLSKQKTELQGLLGHDESHFLWGLVSLLDEMLAQAPGVRGLSGEEVLGADIADGPACGDCAHRHDEHDEYGVCERGNCDCGGWVE